METLNRCLKATRLLETLRLDMLAAYGDDANIYAVQHAVSEGMDDQAWAQLASRANTDSPSQENIDYMRRICAVLVEVRENVESKPLNEEAL
jgi:hypothetical protein